MKEEPLRIKGCLTRETEREFVILMVENENDFYRLLEKIDSPIFDCTESGDTFIIDAKKKIKYILKNERSRA
jgi:hypothetical protein